MLKDLSLTIDECRKSFDNLEYNGDIRIDTTLASLLSKALSDIDTKSTYEVRPFSILQINDEGLRTDLSSSLLWYGGTFWKLVSALEEYQKQLNLLKQMLKNKGHTAEAIENCLKELPYVSKAIDHNDKIGQDINSFVNDMEPNNSKFFNKFLTERDWWFKPLKKKNTKIGKKLNRTDFPQSSFDLASRVIVANSSSLYTLVKAFAGYSELRNYFLSLNKIPISTTHDENIKLVSEFNHSIIGENIIYYGAPGTGKSHQLYELTKGDRKIVTVFHPDTQNSDFIGSLKPTNVSGAVTYAFRPGPFTSALLEALKNPKQNVYLVIEEINRAPAAAVFGELFQLLDREGGASKYKIDFTDPDMQAYINEQLKAACIDELTKLSIPANLSLLATMNSSDQAVMPLDTAFKRRWSFRYMKLDFENLAVSSQNLRIMTTQGAYDITWKDFANKVINHQLKEMKVPEDRLIGPFFLNSTELSNSKTSNEAISGKLFVYLWDDVLRHKGRNIIFDKSIGTFGELHEQFIEGKKSVFSEVIESLIISTVGNSTGVAEGDE
ncbi:McrB family protein [Providencia sp. PROV038]|uniref:McrB family protein n=1 Tax=Providencia sp. PROV038 TaxID=2949769 RepID=UPI00234ADCB8|nr:AAA family ATPase [Providencia sp. PROV038]